MTHRLSPAQRRVVHLELDADESSSEEITAHSADDGWWPNRSIDLGRLPLDDDPLIEAWAGYAAEADASSAWKTLRDKLVQLQFPIRSGISAEDAYRTATLKGQTPPPGDGLVLEEPEDLSLVLHPSLAGKIPILAVRSRVDFETLVRALTARNEPVAIPDAMGACLVNGLNNWDRITSLRLRWEAEDPESRTSTTWGEEFRRIIPQTSLYKDRLIILSRGPYSGVAGKHADVSDDEWERLSFDLRLEHECVHALSLKVFGAMRHDLLEELVADWVALIKVFGRYRADLALRFLGLEAFPDFRAGGRLEVYRGSPPLSDGAFTVMQRLAREVITTLEKISETPSFSSDANDVLGRVTVALLTMSAEALVGAGGADRVLARVENLDETLAQTAG
jgi:Family of unknown function (DUF7005)